MMADSVQDRIAAVLGPTPPPRKYVFYRVDTNCRVCGRFCYSQYEEQNAIRHDGLCHDCDVKARTQPMQQSVSTPPLARDPHAHTD